MNEDDPNDPLNIRQAYVDAGTMVDIALEHTPKMDTGQIIHCVMTLLGGKFNPDLVHKMTNERRALRHKLGGRQNMTVTTQAILEMGDQSREIEDLQIALTKATDDQGRRMRIEISDLIPLVPEIAKLVSKRRAEGKA